MLEFAAYGWGFAAILLTGLAFWVVSLVRNDVSIVDSLWSLMFLIMLGVYQLLTAPMNARGWLVLALVALWSLRLSIYITVRNHGKPEDARYQAIRRNNEPNFRFKSLYIVFGLQAALAGFIAMPLLVASSGTGARSQALSDSSSAALRSNELFSIKPSSSESNNSPAI